MHLSKLFVFSLLVAGCLASCSTNGPNFQLSGVTGHYYRILECFNESWTSLNSYAKTLYHPEKGQGYLMTVNNYEEQRVIIEYPLMAPGFLDVVVGGVDASGNNQWKWTGPDSAIQFYSQERGCMGYCNFVNAPSNDGVPKGLRLAKGTRKWVAYDVNQREEWIFAFVEFGCCQCGLRGTCDESTCTCSCGDNFVGDNCETYIGTCRFPNSPICDPVPPKCIKPSSTSAPTTPPPTPAPLECKVTLTPRVQSGYPLPMNGGGSYGIIDIIVENTGDFVAKRAYFDIVLPSSAYTTTWWQFSRLAPTYIDLPDLAVGATYSLGRFIVEDPGNNNLDGVSFTYNSTVCL